jgi:hypothetical protein
VRRFIRVKIKIKQLFDLNSCLILLIIKAMSVVPDFNEKQIQILLVSETLFAEKDLMEPLLDSERSQN